MKHLSKNTALVAGHDPAHRRSAIATCIALALLAGPVYAQKVTCSPAVPNSDIGPDGVVCGAQASSSGDGTVAFGYQATAVGDRAIAVGRKATATAIDGLALGAGAIVDAGAAGSIALGAGSRATGASLGTASYLTGTTATKELAIGGRRITGVADGANNDDAVTVGQLKAANIGNDLAVRYDWNDANGNKIADAGEITYGSVTMGVDPSSGAPIGGGVVISNVKDGAVDGTSMQAVNGSQLFGVKQTADSALLTANKGWNVSADSGSSANIGPGGNVAFHSTDANLSVAQSGNANAGKVDFTLARNLTLDSAAMGSTLVNATGLTITGGPSVTTAGISAGSKTITNVANGVAPSDAVNMSQLGAVDETANAGWNVTDAAGNTANIGPDGNVTFQSADTNLSVTQKGGDDSGVVEVGLAKNLDLSPAGSVTMGGTLVNTTGLTITGGPSVTTTGISAGSKTITNVANGVASSDAVNMSQLQGVTDTVNAGWNVADVDGNTANIGPDGKVTFQSADSNLSVTQKGSDDDGVVEVELSRNLDLSPTGSVTMGSTLVDAAGLTITGGPSVTTAGINAGSRVITNVADGVASNDAVNMSQLQGVTDTVNAGWNVADVDGNTANIGPDGKVTFQSADSNLSVTQKGSDNDGVVEVELSRNLDLGPTGSVTLGDTVVDTTGLTIANGPSVTLAGIDAGGKKITSIAAGSIADTSTDAVNGSQLYATNRAIEAIGSTAGNTNDLAVKYLWTDANGDGVATPDEIDYGTVNLAGTQGTRIGNVAPGLVSSGSMDAVNGGQLFGAMNQVATYFGGGAAMTAQGLSAPSYLIQGETYHNVGDALQALDVGVTLLGYRPSGSQLLGYTHGSALSGSPPYGNGGPGSTALGAEAHASGVENAVAVGQGAVVAAHYGTAVGQGASASADNAVALGHESVADRANTVSVGSAGNERQVANVADATQGTDAINKRQLDRGVASANSYTDARVTALSDSFEMFQGNVDKRLRKQDRRIDRQGAMSAAMMNMAVSAAGIHTPNRVGIGVGFQGGESALSLGYQRAFSDRATLTFGGAFSSDDQAVGIGAGFGW